MASAMEIMLKSMGLGEVIEMAQALAANGTFEKVLKFADGLDKHNQLLEEIRDDMRRPCDNSTCPLRAEIGYGCDVEPFSGSIGLAAPVGTSGPASVCSVAD